MIGYFSKSNTFWETTICVCVVYTPGFETSCDFGAKCATMMTSPGESGPRTQSRSGNLFVHELRRGALDWGFQSWWPTRKWLVGTHLQFPWSYARDNGSATGVHVWATRFSKTTWFSGSKTIAIDSLMILSQGHMTRLKSFHTIRNRTCRGDIA